MAINDATLRTEIDCGDHGIIVTDEHKGHLHALIGETEARRQVWSLFKVAQVDFGILWGQRASR